MNCRYCQAAGPMPPNYQPRERRCAFPNEGRFVAGGGWGCPVEDALCDLLRDDSRCVQRFYMQDDGHSSFTRLWELFGGDNEVSDSAIWASWYKSRGHFNRLDVVSWSEYDAPLPLSFDLALRVIQSSTRELGYAHLFKMNGDELVRQIATQTQGDKN